MKVLALTAAFGATLLIATSGHAAPKFAYPDTKKVDQKDTYAGSVVVADPYRWLEDDVRTSADVAAWVKAQNEITFGYLKTLPHRDAIRKRLTEVRDYAKYTLPVKKVDATTSAKTTACRTNSSSTPRSRWTRRPAC